MPGWLLTRKSSLSVVRIYFYTQSQLQLSVFLLFVISSCGNRLERFFFLTICRLTIDWFV